MPTIVRAANDENMDSPRSQSTGNTPSRRVLGDVSTNARVNAQPTASHLGKKVMTGSPLKRSFTAAIEGGQGFTYLKKRRMSGDQPLSQVDGSLDTQREHSNPHEGPEVRSRSVPEPLLLPGAGTLVVDLSSPTEPNTPSDSGEDTQGSSVERKSFSSLINYDPSSQQLPSNSYQLPPSSLVCKTVSKAEMLRLRLRVAMYKVRTNQIHTPFSELKVEGDEERQVEERHKATSEAVEEAVASLRREAQARMPTDIPTVPKLQPGPVLKPTAYSSRNVYADGELSSSTPGVSPTKSVATPMGSAEKLSRAESADLTSSAVRGRVAEGLLGLRNAA